jgi:cation diffusion facilitator family transporter
VVSGAFASAQKPEVPAVGVLNWLVMLATMAMNFFVSRYEAREGRRLRSEYLRADAMHTRSDLYVSSGVILSFAAARAGLPGADAVVAGAIGAVIAAQAVQILIRSFHVLTDRAALAADEVRALVLAVPGVEGVREVRTRGGEGAVYVDLIAHVDGEKTLRAAHEIADRIEAALKASRSSVVDVVVHLEPHDAQADRPNPEGGSAS